MLNDEGCTDGTVSCALLCWFGFNLKKMLNELLCFEFFFLCLILMKFMLNGEIVLLRNKGNVRLKQGEFDFLKSL